MTLDSVAQYVAVMLMVASFVFVFVAVVTTPFVFVPASLACFLVAWALVLLGLNGKFICE